MTDDGLCCTLKNELDPYEQWAKHFLNFKLVFRIKNNKVYCLNYYRNLTSINLFDDEIDDYGVHAALRVILDLNITDSALTTSKFDGFKV